MDLKQKRRRLREEHFSIEGLMIVFIIGLIGITFVLASGVFNVKDMRMLQDCISENGLMIIFGFFFIVVCFYCWILFFRNIIMKPKVELLYLNKNKENKIYFLNKKGRIFDCKAYSLEKNCYYYVLKTHDYIYEVLGKANETFNTLSIKEKRSYWLNFYSSMGDFENIFLLPIVYVLLLPGLLSLIIADGFDKIYGLIFSAIPFYFIRYDLIHKIVIEKLNNNMNGAKKYEKLKNIMSVVAIVILFLVFKSLLW